MSDEYTEREAASESCENCGAVYDQAHGYCPHCGSINGEAAENCAEHPRREAVAHCVACEAAICEECAQEMEGRYVCESDMGAADTAPWVILFHSPEEWEVEARRQLLDQSHIPAVRFAPGTLSESLTAEHELRVPLTREDEAREVLDSADFSLVTGDGEWKGGTEEE